MSAITQDAAADHSEAATHKHPSGLYVLFGSEAWERFSYYGMRALLVLYLVNHLKYSREYSLTIYGIYTGLVYFTPLIGGYLADKILGRRKAMLIGGAVMALGHLAMAVESLLFFALALLIIGNGFFKPNISTMVGDMYEEGDNRRDGAFTIFYMGINLGALFSPVVCGTLGEKIGWHYGFSAAALGMGAGLALVILGQKHLKGIGLPPNREAPKAELEAKRDSGYREASTADPQTDNDVSSDARAAKLTTKDYVDVAIWIAGCTLVAGGVILGWKVVGPMLSALPTAIYAVLGLGVVAAVMYLLFKGATKDESEQLLVIIILCLFNIFFWMGFEQAGGTMTLFADNQTDRNVSGAGVIVTGLVVAACGYNFWRTTKTEQSGQGLWATLAVAFLVGTLGLIGYGGYLASKGMTANVPASQFQVINPLCIVAFAPNFARMWENMDATTRWRTSTPTKMAIGMIVLGLGFGVLYAGQKIADSTHMPVSPLWLTVVYVIHTFGELALSPIGLSMVTKLAPPRVASLSMGLWFGSSFIANYLAGTLESRIEQYHVPLYGFLVVSSIGPALLLLALTPILKKWMHGKG